MKPYHSRRIFGFGAVMLLTAALVWLYRTHPESLMAERTQGSLTSDQDALYQIAVKVIQGQERSEVVLDLAGELIQWQQQPGELISKWIHFDRLRILGQDTNQATLQSLLQVPIFSSLDRDLHKFTHFFDPKFPGALRSTQANILNKILVPFSSEASVASGDVLTEKDELGLYKVTYALKVQDRNIFIDKKWLSYESKTIKIDAERNSLHYVMNQDGRLLSAAGVLSFKYDNNETYTIEIEVKPSLSPPLRSGHEAYSVAKMQRYDADTSVQAETGQGPDKSGTSDYLKVLERLEKLDEASSGTEAYTLFSALKSDLLQNPDHSSSLFDKIRHTSSRDPSSQRRMQILFGALAQSQSPKIAEGLAEIAVQCSDDFCRIQALVATSDHPHPTDAVAENLLAVANSQQSADVVGTALLSLGTVADKLDSSAVNISQQLQNKLSDSHFDNIKSTVLAAMGNHGDASYFDSLKTYAEAKDPSVRAAAIYSLRQLPQAAAAGLLLQSIEKETDRNVLLEGFKALAYRDLSQQEYRAMALRAAAIADQDIQQLVARNLINAAKDNPAKLTPAIETLLSQTTIEATKEYLVAEIKLMAPPVP